jgi:uncharacterized protein YcbK (DUF882 family)
LNAARKGRRLSATKRAARSCAALAAGLAALLAATRGTQDAAANGETRTLSILHAHTKESAQITFKRNGRYDSEGLKQLNWLLRDWRVDEPTNMDPRLFDIVWEVHREVGAREPVTVMSAYRSPGTNSMLRRRSKGVSEHSQHMVGKAMDFTLSDVDMARVRGIAMRLQYGGVGYYPGSNFVHLDAGSVRSWPRMTRDQLARIFPDGKTVHMPRDGKPMPGYELARAEILSRGGAVAGQAYAEAGESTTGRRSLWASLFGGDDEDTDYYRSVQGGRGRPAARSSTVAAYAPSGDSEDGGSRGYMAFASVETTRSSAPPLRARPQPAPEQPARMASAAPASSSSPLDFLGQKGSSGEPQASGPVTTQVEPPVTMTPVPPRRPEDLGMIASFSDAPLPPSRPVELAAAVPAPLPPSRFVTSSPDVAVAAAANTEPKGPAPDERAALRALFAAVGTGGGVTTGGNVPTARAKSQPVAPGGNVVATLGPALNLGFSSNPNGDLNAARFTGPAVKPVPVLR